MNRVLKNFIMLLEEETEFCKRLLAILQREKRAVVDSDLKTLNETGKAKENLLLKIRILEEERARVVDQVADALGFAHETPSLANLAQAVHEPYAAMLQARHANLSALVQSIHEVNQGNKRLLKHSLELVRGSLSLLDNLTSPYPVYHRSGRMQTAASGGKVIAGEI